MSTVTNRGFSAILVIVDAKTRKLWKFVTTGKRHPLKILRSFLSQVRSAGIHTLQVRTDIDGDLAHSNKLCSLLYNEYQCGPHTTGGYSSWIDGKVERNIRTLENMESKTRCDSNLLTNLCFFSLDHLSEVYGSLYHSAINESPDFM